MSKILKTTLSATTTTARLVAYGIIHWITVFGALAGLYLAFSEWNHSGWATSIVVLLVTAIWTAGGLYLQNLLVDGKKQKIQS